jgi:hypothetical protein
MKPINPNFENNSSSNLNITAKANGFFVIQKMTNSGVFDGVLNSNMGLISRVRIAFPDGSKNWILITEITFLK